MMDDSDSTRRSFLVKAAERTPEGAQMRLKLAAKFYDTISRHVRKRRGPKEAEDLTHDVVIVTLCSPTFFEKFCAKGQRFRPYLYWETRSALSGAHKASRRIKRGGEAEVRSLDDEELRLQSADSYLSPANVCERNRQSRILVRLLIRSWELVARDYEHKGQGSEFRTLREMGSSAADHEGASRALGMTAEALRQAKRGLRTAFWETVEKQMRRETQLSDAEIQEQIAALRREMR